MNSQRSACSAIAATILGVAVARGGDHAAGEVEEDVAVDVLEHEAAGLLDDDRRGLGAGGQGGGLARDDAGTLRTWECKGLHLRFCAKHDTHRLPQYR